jgi:hypothetical protein
VHRENHLSENLSVPNGPVACVARSAGADQCAGRSTRGLVVSVRVSGVCRQRVGRAQACGMVGYTHHCRRALVGMASLVIALTCWLASASAHAEPSAAERETARSAMDEGDRQRAAGDQQAALASYRAADEIMRVPTTGIEVARTQAQLGLLVEARSSAIETANLPESPGEPSVFGEARRAAAELAAQLEPRVPSIRTVVMPADASYTLTIDGVTLPNPARGLSFKTDPGKHTVVLSASGYASTSEQVSLAEGEQRTLQITLKSPVARLEPSSAPRPATHTAVESPSESSVSPRSAGQIRGYLGLGVGASVLGVGLVTGIMSSVQTHDAKQQCVGNRCPITIRHTLARANTLANVANVTIPLGLLGIAYGVYELLTLPAAVPAAASSDPKLQVQVSTRGAYAVWQGTL